MLHVRRSSCKTLTRGHTNLPSRACDYLGYYGSHNRWGSPENIGLETCLDQFKKKVTKLHPGCTRCWEDSAPDALEKENQNMTCTKHNLNQQPTMKIRSDDGQECKDIECHWEERDRFPTPTQMWPGNLGVRRFTIQTMHVTHNKAV